MKLLLALATVAIAALFAACLNEGTAGAPKPRTPAPISP